MLLKTSSDVISVYRNEPNRRSNYFNCPEQLPGAVHRLHFDIEGNLAPPVLPGNYPPQWRTYRTRGESLLSNI